MEGGRRSQAQRRSIAERSILDAAMKVIAAEGLGGTSLAQIGAAAGYSRGIATHYFGTKENLLVRVLDDAATGFLEALETADFRQADGCAQVTRLVDLMLERAIANPDRARALQIMRAQSLIAAPVLHKAIEDANGASARIIRTMLLAGRASGHVRSNIDVDAIAFFTVGALRGLIGQYLSDPKPAELKQTGQALCAMLRAILQPHHAAD